MDPDAIRRAFEPMGALLQRQVTVLKQAMASISKALSHSMGERAHLRLAPMSYGDEFRRHRRSCGICNPAGNPKPLSVNGADYRRRTRSRRRRNGR
jgi:hypothetical protein